VTSARSSASRSRARGDNAGVVDVAERAWTENHRPQPQAESASNHLPVARRRRERLEVHAPIDQRRAFGRPRSSKARSSASDDATSRSA
jgi:hypothetical protein